MREKFCIDFNQVSVCLITFNEEQFLSECLHALRHTFSDFCVLDMGSLDKTVQIVSDILGPCVTMTEWPRRNLFTSGFAAARNAVSAVASRPFVLQIDADEILTFPRELKAIYLENYAADSLAWKVQRRNLIGSMPAEFTPSTLADYDTSSVERHVRLYRQCAEIEWRGYLHEEVFVSGRRASEFVSAAMLNLEHLSQFRPRETNIGKEGLYAWMLLNAYNDPGLRSTMQQEYITHTESNLGWLRPLAFEFGRRNALDVDWPTF